MSENAAHIWLMVAAGGNPRRLGGFTRDGRVLLMPTAPTRGRELKLVLNFDELIWRKLAEAGQHAGEAGGRK